MKDDLPSQTSLSVALAIVILGGDEYGRRFLPSGCLETTKALLKACRLPFGNFPFILCNQLVSKIARWGSALVVGELDFLPGVGYRKIWIERQTRLALAEGGTTKPCRQVLVVAAGYDTLAYRLAKEFPLVTFVEVDHPATAGVKVAGVDKLGRPSNLHSVAADLTVTSLSNTLKTCPFYDPTLPTVTIMEGLLFYLEEEVVREVFREVAKIVGPGSMTVIDFFGLRSSNKKHVDLGRFSFTIRTIVAFLGEPMLWGIQPESLPDFFANSSWEVATPIARKGIERLVGLRKKP